MKDATFQPTYDDLIIDEEKWEGKGPDHPDRIAELHAIWDEAENDRLKDNRDYSDYIGDYDHEYD